MRLLAASLLLLCALSVSAATRQETIHLRYLQASDLDRVLISSSSLATPDAKPLGSNILARSGSLAWTVDAANNTLRVTGSDEAITEIKAIVRILDVKPRQFSVKIEVWDKSDALLRGLGVDPAADPAATRVARANYRLELAALVAQGKAHILDSTSLNGTPGQAMRLVWSPPSGGEVHYLSATSRLNGDGTVNLTVTPTVNLGSGTLTSAEKTFRHLPSGETGVTVLPTGQVLLITATILPEVDPQP